MNINRNTGLLEFARYLPSPNCDDRPDPNDISLVVIHNISLPPNEFGGDGIDQLFTNQLDPDEHPYYSEIHGLRVSSHLLIRRDGEIVQYVPFQQRAWHAGQSQYADREDCNDFSIGIELEGADDIAYEERQYEVLSEVIDALCGAYAGLSKDRIAGHCDISPGRKTDPGEAFKWGKLNHDH